MNKEVMILVGAGQIGMAISRRMGFGKKIVVGDKNINNAKNIAKIMNNAGFDVKYMEMDLSSRESIKSIIKKHKNMEILQCLWMQQEFLQVKHLKVDLYGTAVLFEEVGKVIAKGGVGVTIPSQSGHRMPALSQEVANVAELLMSQGGAFITGTDFLIDGGATASYFYGPLKPEV